MKIGAQLYTVRDYTKNLDDFAETLKKVADIGYTTVRLRHLALLKRTGSRNSWTKPADRCHTHTNQTRVAEDTEAVIAEHKVFGCDYIGLGSLPWELHHNPAGAGCPLWKCTPKRQRKSALRA